MTRRLALAVPLSIGLHAAVVAALMTATPPFDAESALFMDLTLPGVAENPAPTRDSPVMPPPRPSRHAPSGPARVWSSLFRKPASRGVPAPAIPAPAVGPPAGGEAAPTPKPDPGPSPDAAPGAPPPVAVPEFTPPPGPVPAATASAPAEGATAARPDAGGTRSPGAPPSQASGAAAFSGREGADGRSGARGSGSPGGGDGDGALAAVAGDERPGAEYGPYLAGVRRRVAAALRYPPAARRRGLSGTVHIEMVIAASGVVTAAEVVASSSHTLLDDAALETVKSLGRQPFPEHLRPRTLRVRLPVVFNLE